MSLIGINNFYPYSLTGLQNITGTVNGFTPIVSITIAGQTFYLTASTPDINGNVVLTLNIATATTSTTGLLTSTDWNTFNSKENGLTFNSPLTRVGNNISFDYGVNNVWTGSLNSFDNAIEVSNFNPITLYPFRVYRRRTTFPNEFLYYDNLGNLGHDGTGNNWFITSNGNASLQTANVQLYANISNILNQPQAIRVYRNQATFALEYLYYSNAGTLGITSGAFNWTIDRNGLGTFNTLNTGMLNATNAVHFSAGVRMSALSTATATNVVYINGTGILTRGALPAMVNLLPLNNSWTGTNDFNGTHLSAAGRFFVRNNNNANDSMTIFRNQAVFPSEYLFYNREGRIGIIGGAFNWSIQRNGLAEFTFSRFINNGLGNGWISGVFGRTNTDCVVAGFLGDLVVGLGATIGGHVPTLTAWADLHIQPDAFSRVSIGNPSGVNAMAQNTLTICGGSGSSNGVIQVRCNNNLPNNVDGMAFRAFGDFNHIINFENTGGALRGRIQGNGAGAVSYITTSDRRLKKNFRDMSSMIDTIKKIKPLEYEWISDDRTEAGFVAQDIHKIFPLLKPPKSSFETYCKCDCDNFDEENPMKKDGTIYPLGLDYGSFTPYLTKALQEVIVKVETLEEENKLLKDIIERITKIEDKLFRNREVLKY
jgi:hypothetical protein